MAECRLGTVLQRVRSELSDAGVETANLDARLIVEHCSGTTRTQAIGNPEIELSPGVCDAIDIALARRLSGEPVHRILGFREFYGMRLALSAETLEPRPDTETLVDAVLPIVREIAERKGICRILDLGTGTGAIALALLKEVSKSEAIGVDISSDALETAAANAQYLGLSARFAVLRGPWFENVEGEFDVIVSNPPYIKREDLSRLDREVRDFDPPAALDGGEDGLEAYKAIAAGLTSHLAPDGTVAVEIGFDQAAEVEMVFAQMGLILAQKYRDLAQNDRVLRFIFRENQYFADRN